MLDIPDFLSSAPYPPEAEFNGMALGYVVMTIKDMIRDAWSPEEILLTGSQLFGDATDKSDIDFVVKVKSLRELQIDWKLWEDCGADGFDDEQFIIVRNERNVNLIFTDDPIRFRLWERCTAAASALNLNKEQRSILFHEIINHGI